MAVPLFSIKGYRFEFMVNKLCYELRKSHSNHFHVDEESLVTAVSLTLAFFPVSTTFLFSLFDQERGSRQGRDPRHRILTEGPA